MPAMCVSASEKSSSLTLFRQDGKQWAILSISAVFAKLRVKQKDSGWLDYPLSSKWASIEFRAWTITTNSDIYFVWQIKTAVSPGSLCAQKKQKEEAQSVGDPFNILKM